MGNTIVPSSYEWSELDKVQVNIFTEDAWFVCGVHKLYPQWSYTEVSVDNSVQLYGTVRSNDAINIFIGHEKPNLYEDINPSGFLSGSFYGIGTYEILSQIYETVFGKEAPMSVDIKADRKGLTPSVVRELAKDNPYPEEIRLERSRRVFVEAEISPWLHAIMKNEKINIFSESKRVLRNFFSFYPNWAFTLVTPSGSLEEFGEKLRYADGYNIFVGCKGLSACSELCKTGYLDGKVFLIREFRAVYEIARIVYGEDAIKEFDVRKNFKPYIFKPTESEKACRLAGVGVPASVWVKLSKMSVTVYVDDMHVATGLYTLCPTWAYLICSHHGGVSDWVPLFNTTPEIDSYRLSVVQEKLIGPLTGQVIHTDIYNDAYKLANILLDVVN